MSGQWEVVGKRKEKTVKSQAPKSGNNKENKPKIVVKVEDVLPQSQIKNLFNAPKNAKEPQKAQDKGKKVEAGNQQKKAKKPQQPAEKPEPQAKPKAPKSIESALNSIEIEEFRKVYEENRTFFPNAPIVWLKELAQFLNHRIPVDIPDPLFQNKSETYPCSVIPSQMKSVMERACSEAGADNARVFFDICLSTIATDMARGQSAIGHKLFVQLLALRDPEVTVANVQKTAALRTSYQNRQNVCLSILWALGAGGVRDLNVGFKVFREVMFPLIEMKGYSRYICGYLVGLINRFNDVPLSKEQYQFVMEFVHSNRKNLPVDLNAQIQKQKMKELLFVNSKDKYHGFVEYFLRNMTARDSAAYRDELCDVVIACLTREPSTFAVWAKCYTKNLMASAVLLNYINDNWNGLRKKFSRKVLSDILNTFSLTNNELLSNKRKQEGLMEAIEAIEAVRAKMVVRRRSGPGARALLALAAAAALALLAADLRRAGGDWRGTACARALRDLGVEAGARRAGGRAADGAAWALDRFRERFPGLAERAGPYAELARDAGKYCANAARGLRDALVDRWPAIVESIEAYAPGLIEQSSKTVQNVWSTSILYFNRSVDYLKQEIFVGQLAPENVQRLVIDALNTTQQKASEYYYWLYEKVQSTIK